MRKIIFRGKRTDNNEWVYGVPVEVEPYFEMYYFNFEEYEMEHHLVIPETIGQYTGLIDKNGKKIFEDDIVKVTDDNGEMNMCSCGIGYVIFYDGVWYIDDEVNDGLYDVSKIYHIEVIGNIHDNPELLKGGADNGKVY